MLEIAVLVLFVLTVVTLLGHGLWVMLAAFFRAIAGASVDRRERPPPEAALQRPTLQSDLQATARQLRRLINRGAISQERGDELLELVQQEQTRLREIHERQRRERLRRLYGEEEQVAEPVFPAEPPRGEPLEEARVPTRPAAAGHRKTPQPPRRTPDLAAESGPRSPPSAREPGGRSPPAASRPSSAPAVTSPATRQPLSDLLQAFMEEKNIRWGELISGMLIVGCGVGLVISLWSSLKEAIPYFPALLFMLATAAIHAAGLYTLKRWKLKSTSRGLLLISVLLVPLNFLAAIALSHGPAGEPLRPVTDPVFLTALAVGLAGYSAISYSASRTLLRRRQWTLFVAVMGPSVGQLLISRLAAAGRGALELNLLTAFPSAAFLAVMLSEVQTAGVGNRLTLRRANRTFMMLGVALFALLMPIGLCVWRTGGVGALREVLQALSPSLSAVSAAVLSLGLLVHQRATAPLHANIRMAGTALALTGATLLAGWPAVAWPRPDLLLAVSLIDLAVLTALAFLARSPVLHGPAVAALSLAGLLAFHLLAGTATGGITGLRLLETLFMGRSSLVLLAVSGFIAVAAFVAKRRRYESHAAALIWCTLGVATAGLIVAAWAGFVSGVDSSWVILVFAVYAVAGVAGAATIRRREAAWIGSGLLFVTLLHALIFNEAVLSLLERFSLLPHNALFTAALCHATLVVGLAVISYLRNRAWESFGRPLLTSAAFSTLLAALLVPIVGADDLAPHAGYAFWIAALWLAAAWMERSRGWTSAGQAASLVGVVFALAAFCRSRDWWTGWYGDPRHVQWQLAALALWALAWTAVRLLVSRVLSARAVASRHSAVGSSSLPAACDHLANDGGRCPPCWLCVGGPAVDRVVLGGVLVLTLLVAVVSALPGVLAETSVAASRSGVAGASSFSASASLIMFWALALGAIIAMAITFGRKTHEASGTLGHSSESGGAQFSGALLAAALLGVTAGLLAFVSAHPRPPSEELLRYAMLSAGLWIALAVGTVAGAASMWDTVTGWSAAGLMLAGLTAATLAAAQIGGATAAASVLQWLLAGFFLLIVGALVARRTISRSVRRLGIEVSVDSAPTVVEVFRVLGLVPAGVFCLAIALAVATLLGSGRVPAGPGETGFFGWLGRNVSLAIPVWMIAAGIAVEAVRTRRPPLALSASLLAALGVGLIYVIPVLLSPGPVVVGHLFYVVAWTALVLGACLLAWHTGRKWIEGDRGTRKLVRLDAWNIQLAFAVGLVVIPAAWAVVSIAARPSRLPVHLVDVGSPVAFTALAVVTIAWLWRWRPVLIHSPGLSRNPAPARRGSSDPGDSPTAGLPAARPAVVHLAGGAALAAVALFAAALAGHNSAVNWLSYHVLHGGWTALAGMAAVAACLVVVDVENGRSGASLRAAFVGWACALAGVAVFLAVRAEWHGPWRPWWSAAATLAAGLTVGSLAVLKRRQTFAHAATGLVMLAVTFVYLAPWLGIGVAPTKQSWLMLVEANVVAACLCGLLWLGLEIVAQTTRKPVGSSSHPLHHNAALAATIVMTLLAVLLPILRSRAEASYSPFATPVLANPGTLLTVAIAAILLVGTLWDRRGRFAVPALYVLGASAALVGLDALDLIPRHLAFAIGCAAAGYALVTGLLWAGRSFLASLGRELGWPEPVLRACPVSAESSAETLAEPQESPAARALRSVIGVPLAQRIAHIRWLTAGTLLLTATTLVIHLVVVLTFPEEVLRWCAAVSTIALAPAVLLLANGDSREPLRVAGLLLGSTTPVYLSWALLPTGAAAEHWLLRTIVLMEVLAAATFVYAGAARRLPVPGAADLAADSGEVSPTTNGGGDWQHVFLTAATILGGASLAALVVVLMLEGALFDQLTGAPVTVPHIVAVAAVLVGLAAGLVWLAVLPNEAGEGDTGTSTFSVPGERARMGYVFTAEGVVALLFLHLYLTVPELFTGYFLPYWRYIVLALAFVGAGLGEWFARQGLWVLAEPLQKTGAFLPLLPAIAFWVAAGGRDYFEYSTVLFLAGLLYVCLSMWRRSFVYALLAALAGNAALWSLWYDQGTTLLTQPQLWMIPPALSVLLAAQLNRRRLSEAQLTGVRYLCVTVIYVASTGDMFVKGIGEVLWPPMVLAALSVAGVLTGIMLRVRAFLYLGSSFLLLSIVSMVWHAARSIGHVWPWWVFGIALGLAILALFGLFEKKRREVLAVIDRMKQWEP